MSSLLRTALSNVSLGTSNDLAYLMILMVGVFLISGPLIVYIFRKKARSSQPAAPSHAG